MLAKDSFPLTYLFFMLPNIGNTENYLYQGFHRNKRSMRVVWNWSFREFVLSTEDGGVASLDWPKLDL